MRDINMSEIEIMTHEQAVSSKAVERYILGELSEEEQSAFEAHYFDCKLCFEQIELSQDFMRQARPVLSEKPESTVERIDKRVIERGWLATVLGDFRRPAMAFVSAMLLCAVGIGLYQQNEISSLKGPRLEARYMLRGDARGGAQILQVSRNTALSLRVEFLRKPELVSYKAQILSESGKVKYSVPIPSGQTDDSVIISLPASALDPGKYALVVLGVTADGNQTAAGHGSFELQFTN